MIGTCSVRLHSDISLIRLTTLIKTKDMKRIIQFIFRLISAPFVTFIVLLAALKHCLMFMIDYIKYGGEFIAYPEKSVLIKDVYMKVKELVKDE